MSAQSKLPMFAQNLLKYRVAAGISRYRLAQTSGISLPQIGKLERGVMKPYLETAQALAQGLGVDLSTLAGPALSKPAPPRKKPHRRPTKAEAAEGGAQ